MAISGYSLMNSWYKWRKVNIDKARPVHSDMFCYIVFLWNNLGQPEMFGLPTDKTMNDLGMGSYKTYKKCFEELVKFGFLKVIKASKNQHLARVISFSAMVKSAEANAKASAEANTKAGVKATANASTAIIKELQSNTKLLNKERFISNLNLNASQIEISKVDSFFVEAFTKYWTETEQGVMRCNKLPFFDMDKQIQMFAQNRAKFLKSKPKNQENAKPKHSTDDIIISRPWG